MSKLRLPTWAEPFAGQQSISFHCFSLDTLIYVYEPVMYWQCTSAYPSKQSFNLQQPSWMADHSAPWVLRVWSLWKALTFFVTRIFWAGWCSFNALDFILELHSVILSVEVTFFPVNISVSRWKPGECLEINHSCFIPAAPNMCTIHHHYLIQCYVTSAFQTASLSSLGINQLINQSVRALSTL